MDYRTEKVCDDCSAEYTLTWNRKKDIPVSCPFCGWVHDDEDQIPEEDLDD